jgi:hypothetical protein
MLKLLKLASDGIFAFSIVPLRAAALLGTLAISLSALFAAYSLIAKVFLRQSPKGFTALVFLITFLSGVLLLFLGIIGEYVGRIYEEIKARPLYVVNKIIDYAPPRPMNEDAGALRADASKRSQGINEQDLEDLLDRTRRLSIRVENVLHRAGVLAAGQKGGK